MCKQKRGMGKEHVRLRVVATLALMSGTQALHSPVAVGAIIACKIVVPTCIAAYRFVAALFSR
jgi:hypothetical protein